MITASKTIEKSFYFLVRIGRSRVDLLEKLVILFNHREVDTLGRSFDAQDIGARPE